jgi:hypothetical protein
MMETAKDIHANRLAGLYVEGEGAELNIPSKAISQRQSRAIIDAAKAFLQIVEAQTPRDDIPEEDVDLQAWFLNAFDDLNQRKYILTAESFAKLRELQNVAAWTRWIKSEIERDEAELKSLAEKEFERSKSGLGSGQKDKWKIQFRLETHSHSIRPGPLKIWNDAVHWIKLVSVQGPKNKSELIVEVTLGDNVPVEGLWDFGLFMARNVILALNLATSGFWWWVLPRHKERYYEKIQDLENKRELQLSRPDLKVFDDRHPALTDVNVKTLISCFISLPRDGDEDRIPALTRYLGGLTFWSINDLHWRCEPQAFGNFAQALKLLMKEAEFPLEKETFVQSAGRFLKEKYPDLDPAQHVEFVKLLEVFDSSIGGQAQMSAGDLALVKLLCETMYRDSIVPNVLKKKADAFARNTTQPPEPGS